VKDTKCINTLEFVPESLKTQELCFEAVKDKGDELRFVPENLKKEIMKMKEAMAEVRHYEERAVSNYLGDNCEAAIADYTKVIELRGNADDYRNRADVYRFKSDWASAIADYTKVIELRGNAEDYKRRAYIYAEKIYDYDSAIADYTKVIELRGNADDYSDLAECNCYMERVRKIQNGEVADGDVLPF